jgi:hypothetical protein
MLFFKLNKELEKTPSCRSGSLPCPIFRYSSTSIVKLFSTSPPSIRTATDGLCKERI